MKSILTKYEKAFRIARVIAGVVVFLPILIGYPGHPTPIKGFADSAFKNNTGNPEPFYEESFISDVASNALMVHSASIAQFGDGVLRCVWFQGSREGGRDVALYLSSRDSRTRKWSAPSLLVSREEASVQIGRMLKTIGNPVFFTAPNGRTWLFFVTVSLFGWSGGDINFKFTDDNGANWSSAKRLRTSPIAHSGTLVKGSAIPYEDGSIALPVYRSYDQFSFSELVSVDAAGEVQEKVTMSNAERGALQPSVTALDGRRAVALMRYNGDDPKRVLRSVTSDAGLSWSTPEKLNVPNPDSAVASLGLSDGSMILVFNNSTQYRNVLSLARSTDLGVTWKNIYIFEASDSEADGVTAERSYPSMVRDNGGTIQLVYTWNRRKIKHICFNEAWIRTLDE